ncbi:TonB-dependent receptor [Luminiphilus sp.]|nr:TonB-dependent receptor [Luminiphilus sp.]
MKQNLLYPAIVLALASTPAMGQSDTSTNEIEEIVITGSLIQNPNLTRAAPVAVISEEEMDQQAIINVEEILREVPGAVPSIGANVNNGNGGFSYVNLRGLGSNRNLVLIDGQRYAPSELAGRFDLNNIPVAMIERLDVLTGGASTTYGADALSGVVNVITKKDFTGVEINADFGQTDQSDGDEKSFDITIGSDLADGRGNATLSLGYRNVEPVYQGARRFSEDVLFYWVGSRGGSGLGSFNTRIGNVNPTGGDNANLSLGGVQDDRTFASAFTPYNYGPSNVFQTPLKTYNMYSTMNFEVTDKVEAYATALYNENTVRTLIAPSGAFGDSVTIALNHPFLSDAQRNAVCAFDTNPVEGAYTPRFTQAQCDAAGVATGPTDPGYLTFDTQMRRRNVEGGPRISEYVARYFNSTVGLRGELNDTTSFDVMASYGKSDQTSTAKGYWLKSRFRQSLLSGPDGCNDSSGGCVPVDFFGPTGSITDDMNAFLAGGESNVSTLFDMSQVKGNISGELPLSLPMADDSVNYAIGAEYRDYAGAQVSDLLSQAGDLGGGGSAAPNISGGFDVTELVVELAVPVVQGAEFAEEITAEFGYRYSDYNIDSEGDPSFSTDTYKVGLSWTPIDDIRFRASYARAVRAPNISELFSPVITGLGNLSVDPCASVGDDGTNSGFVPTGALADVCVAQGAPAATLGFIPQPAAGQVNVTGGGNVNVQPEESDSYTIGFVAQPSAIPGLTVSVDYYDIEVDGAISAPTESDLIALCFTDPDPTNSDCLGISRSPIDGGLSGDNDVVKGLPAQLANTGVIATKGIDFSVSYGRDIGMFQWNSSLNGNVTDSSTFQAVKGVSLNRECVGYYSSNCSSIQPERAFNWRNTVSWDDFDVSLNWRFISAADYESFVRGEDVAFSGLLPDARDADLGEQNFNNTPDYSIFDLSARYQYSENISIRAVISNLADRDPPLTGAFIGTTGYNSGNTYPSTYDALGRRFNIAIKASF